MATAIFGTSQITASAQFQDRIKTRDRLRSAAAIATKISLPGKTCLRRLGAPEPWNLCH
jgi:hypothetical protein